MRILLPALLYFRFEDARADRFRHAAVSSARRVPTLMIFSRAFKMPIITIYFRTRRRLYTLVPLAIAYLITRLILLRHIIYLWLNIL